jgi:hypothetical protein
MTSNRAQMKLSPGPPEQLSKEQQDELKNTILDLLPSDVGFTAKFNWTLPNNRGV